MKTISKRKRVLYAFIAIVVILTGASVVTDTPPIVFIGGKPHLVFSGEIDLNQYEREFSNKDVKALKHMRWVKRIEMWGTEITDISFLNEMKYLKKIVWVCDDAYLVDDWTPLSNCKKLVSFMGWIPNISDLSTFKELTNLDFLYVNVNGSEINDITDVRYLTNLERFCVGGKNITDISSLKCCPKLRYLSLVGTTADADYSVLLDLPDLNLLFIDKGVLTGSEISALKIKGVNVHENEQSEPE